MDNQKGQPAQAGISLIITLFIMIIVLAVVLSISVILYSEIKVMRNVGSSVVGFYAADSGIEKVLFYDRQVRLTDGETCDFDFPANCNGTHTPQFPVCVNHKCTTFRGLCEMVNSCASSGTNSSTFCNGITANGTYCSPTSCSNCSVSFSTTFPDNKKVYNTIATTKPDVATGTYDFTISSTGSFSNAQRTIYISITTP